MSETDENASERSVGGAPVAALAPDAPAAGAPRPVVSFDRRELDQILRLYGRMVADGEWRDYAIDLLKDKAVFSVFRRTSEMPMYRIEKDPKLARRQGAYSVVAAGGLILKRGHELASVLRVLEKKRHLRLVDA
ncbi:DUF2794 domain-containing protein [Polymorphum gilvum]|uniref:Hypothetical conserved protein n=1 Tax=Polymorphum gilvum (strain LMG 25793 / CGMCC 1.9160 / SL003B-26A1) TaxID=991905 RepID=F2J304_POLGS|nr:DUF2794 domain-containing protein [Polymorphum gilvum]ADZ68874.1 Hypothetical conserved protein [Polymorphum gilvum SL003B-26A1]